MITKSMIAAGYRAGIVTLCESPNEDGVVCRIGENWFYFGGQTAEGSSVEEYKKCVPEEDIIDEIFSALDDFRKAGPDFEDEYLYYEFFLQEHGISADGNEPEKATPEAAETRYRIRETCWDALSDGPYVDRVATIFDSEEVAQTALRACVKDELETLNEREIEDVDLEYPSECDDFKVDFDGDQFDAFVRLWKGDDYWPVTGYTVEKISVITNDTWMYRELNNRSFYVFANNKTDSFVVVYNGKHLCVKHSLVEAFDFVDEEIFRRERRNESAKEWTLPVTWEVCGFVKIKAPTLEEAIDIFNATSDDIPLPTESTYVDGSFALTANDTEYINIYNK